MRGHKLSEGRILGDIRRVARVLQHSPSSVEYRRHGRYDLRAVQRKFRLPWARIVGRAGLRYTPRTSHTIPSTKELRRDISRVARDVGHPPTRSEYEVRGRFDAETIKRRVGQRRWEEALAALTGVDTEEVKRHQQKGGCYRTTHEWLERLRGLSEGLGHAPTTGEANRAGINAQELRRIGAGWGEVLRAAGVRLPARSPRAAARGATADEMLADVAALAQRLGRAPLMREYEARGRYPCGAVSKRLGAGGGSKGCWRGCRRLGVTWRYRTRRADQRRVQRREHLRPSPSSSIRATTDIRRGSIELDANKICRLDVRDAVGQAGSESLM